MKLLKIESGESQVLRVPYDVMNAAAFIEARDVTILANGELRVTGDSPRIARPNTET